MIRIPGDLYKSLEISDWLKQKGYKHGVDYTWYLESHKGNLVVRCKDQKLETLLALVWQ